MEIINTLNIEELRKQYQEAGYVVIKNLLQHEVAQAAYEALRHFVPWEFHYREMNTDRVGVIEAKELKGLTPREIKRLIPAVARLKDNDFSFAYCRYTIPSQLSHSLADAQILTQIYRYLNSKEYLGLLAEITGDDSGKEVSAWCSRYDHNHHLSVHMDESPGQQRIAAHVLGLSKNWRQDWGGNFAFCDDEGKPDLVVPPMFNALMMFKVPRLHLVTQVEPFAGDSRYSIFGWYKGTQEYFTE